MASQSTEWFPADSHNQRHDRSGLSVQLELFWQAAASTRTRRQTDKERQQLTDYLNAAIDTLHTDRRIAYKMATNVKATAAFMPVDSSRAALETAVQATTSYMDSLDNAIAAWKNLDTSLMEEVFDDAKKEEFAVSIGKEITAWENSQRALHEINEKLQGS